MNSPVTRAPAGGFRIDLSRPERELLRSLAPQMREVFESKDDVLERLFPVAYPEDNDRESEYRLLVHDELRDSYLRALGTLEATAAATELGEEEVHQWMQAINQVRLVLGTRLEVTEEGYERPDDEDDPRNVGFAVYDYLTYLQGSIIDALTGGGDEGDDDDEGGDEPYEMTG